MIIKLHKRFFYAIILVCEEMKKIKYLFRIINEINEKSKRRKIDLFFDILYCCVQYKASFKDYDFFEMYTLTDFERKTILTQGINKDFIRKYNNPKYVRTFNDMIFKKTFEKYLKMEKLELKQCKLLTEICPNSLNTILIVMLLGQVVLAYIEVGGEEKLIAPIDIETGVITHPLCDKNKNVYKKHSDSEIEVEGIQIPNWDKVLKLSEQASLEVAAIGYASFEIAIEENKCYLINGSVRPNYHYFGLPPHRNNNIGILPLFKKKEERKVKE